MPPAASLELVDERGRREGALTILEPGTSISVFQDAQHRVSMTADRSATDVAWFRYRDDGTVEIEIKQPRVLLVAGRDGGDPGRVEVAPDTEVELVFEALHKTLRVGWFVVHDERRADDASADHRAWARGTIARGLERVHARLERLRQAGLIDEHDQPTVGMPADMQPGSRTEV